MNKSKKEFLWISAALALGVFLILFCVFQRWQLHYSYDEYLHMSKPGPGIFYNGESLRQNKSLVREWIRADFLSATDVRMAIEKHNARQAMLLGLFGTEEDLAILLDKAKRGFPFPPGYVCQPPNDSDYCVSGQRFCSSYFTMGLIDAAYHLKGEKACMSFLKNELERIGAAPEIMREFQHHYDREQAKLAAEAPGQMTPTPSDNQPAK